MLPDEAPWVGITAPWSSMDQSEVSKAVAQAWRSLPELRDWQTEFLSGFSVPTSHELALRLQMNLRRFQHNYLYVFAAGLVIAVLMNPFFLLSTALIAAMTKYGTAHPIRIKDYELSNHEKIAAISAAAIFLNYMCGTFHTLLLGMMVGMSFVACHAFCHNPFSRTGIRQSEDEGNQPEATSEV